MRPCPPVFWALLFSLLLLLAAGTPVMAAPGLPITLPPGSWQPLEQRQDPALQLQLTRTLKQRPGWQALITTQKMAVGLVDLSDPQAPRFAQVNGGVMLYAASLPKIAVLLAAFQAVENRTLALSPQIKQDLEDMIRQSSNPAAARLINRLGLQSIVSLLFNPRYRFYDVRQGGGIWVGSTFSSQGERFSDPLKDLHQAANATQVCRFYYALAYGRLINPRRSAQMLEVMSRPELPDKFVRVLQNSVPPDRIFRKNGTFQTTHGDSVLVWGEGWRRYILVGLVEDAQGEQILQDLVPVGERLLRQTRP